MCPFNHDIFEISYHLSLPPFSFLEWTPLVWSLHLVGDFSTIRTHRRAAGIRIHLLSAALLVRSPEGRRVYCMCIIPRGTTLVVLLHRVVVSRGLHQQRSDGDVIPSSVYMDRVAFRRHRGSARHRGLPIRLQQPRSCGNVSRLMDYILVCDLFLSITCIA